MFSEFLDEHNKDSEHESVNVARRMLDSVSDHCKYFFVISYLDMGTCKDEKTKKLINNNHMVVLVLRKGCSFAACFNSPNGRQLHGTRNFEFRQVFQGFIIDGLVDNDCSFWTQAFLGYVATNQDHFMTLMEKVSRDNSCKAIDKLEKDDISSFREKLVNSYYLAILRCLGNPNNLAIPMANNSVSQKNTVAVAHSPADSFYGFGNSFSERFRKSMPLKEHEIAKEALNLECDHRLKVEITKKEKRSWKSMFREV